MTRINLFKLVVVIAVAAVATWYFDVSSGILWTVFASFAIFEWDNRIVGVIAIVALATCPILLSLEKEELAEQRAVYAFFFLVITVALQLLEFLRHPERFKHDEDTYEST